MQITIDGSDFGQPEPLDVSALLKDGWVYCDPPTRFSFPMWDLFCAIIGVPNYRLLAMTTGEDKNGPYKRGQFIISPEGQRRMKDKDLREEIGKDYP